MKPLTLACALVPGFCLVIASCDRETPRASQGAADSPIASTPPVSASEDMGPLGVHRPAELVEAAKNIIGFLRGEVPFDRIRVADTVTLYLSPEGGGTRTELDRETLRDPSKWKVRSRDLSPQAPGMEYSLAPRKDSAELTTLVGRHLKCREYSLASVSEEFAQFPHVGTMLSYGGSCLQTRNVTLVFDPERKPPTLIAAIYDQWEW